MRKMGSIKYNELGKPLWLTLKKEWFDMIANGKKKEEYREIKPYWDSRLNKDYDFVIFRNGYAKDAPIMYIHINDIRKGIGDKKWGAPEYEVYIIELGDIIHIDNY
jgi:hypothetical protein